MNLTKHIINNKKIIENFSYLTILQVISLIAPLITYPYLLKVVGLEKYGVVIFAQTMVTYFSLLINFGYNISGPKDVAVRRDDHILLSEYVSSIYIIKSLIWALCFVVYAIVIYSLNFFHDNLIVYFFAYFITLSDVFFPIWFFQGIEKMKYITYLNLFVRCLFIAAIFVFIKNESDYIYIPLLNSIGALVSGSIAIYIVFKKEGVTFIRVSKNVLSTQLKEGFMLFVSTISIQLYLNLNIKLFKELTYVSK
jgi:PST family polysaccharide transporter